MILQLDIFASTEMGVFSRLTDDGPDLFTAGYGLGLFTVERPWLGNQVNVSCIPGGRYRLERSYYNRGDYACYEVMDVLGRTEIKFHIGNTIDDVQGCIAPGTSLGSISGKWAVNQSKKAFSALMSVLDSSEAPHYLHINRTLENMT